MWGGGVGDVVLLLFHIRPKQGLKTLKLIIAQKMPQEGLDYTTEHLDLKRFPRTPDPRPQTPDPTPHTVMSFALHPCTGSCFIRTFSGFFSQTNRIPVYRASWDPFKIFTTYTYSGDCFIMVLIALHVYHGGQPAAVYFMCDPQSLFRKNKINFISIILPCGPPLLLKMTIWHSVKKGCKPLLYTDMSEPRVMYISTTVRYSVFIIESLYVYSMCTWQSL